VWETVVEVAQMSSIATVLEKERDWGLDPGNRFLGDIRA
jgi:hypothetical protein